MQKDKITLVLKDILKVKGELKELKKSIRGMEKCDEEKYVELKQAVKEMRIDMKEIQEMHMSDLMQDSEYHSLQELKMKKDEELAKYEAQLKNLLHEDHPKKIEDFPVVTDDGSHLVQVLVEPEVYIDGKKK